MVNQRWDRLVDAGVAREFPSAVAGSIARVLAWSGFVADVLARQPALLEGEWARKLDARISTDELRASVAAAVAEAKDDEQLKRILRRQRHAWLARIAWRDIMGWADDAEIHASLTAVAEACISGALNWLHDQMRQRHGEARDSRGNAQQLIVLGMGKLGGAELNFSSDIDLIFSFAEAGQSDGNSPLDNEQYFTRLGQRLIQVLHEATEDGFVYRVDMRLRPFGESGPLVQSFAGMEVYYQQHGREWERYAFVKARPVAGDIAAGEQLLEILRPFVYRRYLDYGVFAALRDIKSSINREVERLEFQDHVKLGPGGIREAEFVVQLFQLIRGGREPAMRERHFLDALPAVADAECLPASEAAELEQAYRFLRRLENRLQEQLDRQTHDLPASRADREVLAWSLGYASYQEFQAEWDAHRSVVSRLFAATVLGPEDSEEAHPLIDVWADPDSDHEVALETAGFHDAARVEEMLGELRNDLRQQRPGVQGQRRIDELIPKLLEAAGAQDDPELSLERMCRLIAAISRRTTYLALLAENPNALRQLARVCGASDWISRLVTGHPVLLDELIDPRLFDEAPDPGLLESDLQDALSQFDGEDLEAVMDVLREFQQTRVMRIAAADIAGRMPVMAVSDALSAVAEVVVRAVLREAENHLVRRHGRPKYRVDGEEREARFLVVAYGKLGGLELGYGSDLDLVFMHDSRGEDAVTDGERSLDNSVYFMRLAQRLIHLMSTPTSAGILYEVDTRLRPSGKGGLLVTSLEAFEKYQRENAWTWEHQALLRSRPVAGDSALAVQFGDIRRRVLTQPRDVEALRREVAAMRSRMRSELKLPEGMVDLKASPGGLTDIEFLAQYWVLAHASQYPDLVTFGDTIRCLEGLDSCACVESSLLAGLVDAYRELREHIHRQALQGRNSRVPVSVAASARDRVRAVWKAVFPDTEDAPPDGADLKGGGLI